MVKNISPTAGYHLFLSEIITLDLYNEALYKKGYGTGTSIPSASSYFHERFSPLYDGKREEKVMDAATIIFFIAMNYIIHKRRLCDGCDIITITEAHYRDCGGGFTRLPLTVGMQNRVHLFPAQGLQYHNGNGGILLEAEPYFFSL